MLCFRIQGNLQGLGQVMCLWIEYCIFTKGVSCHRFHRMAGGIRETPPIIQGAERKMNWLLQTRGWTCGQRGDLSV